MTQRNFTQRGMIIIGIIGLLGAGSARAQESEVVIVKYGKVLVKSSVPETKVYVDDIYKGPAGNVIESVTAGVHAISCRAETQVVSSTFEIKKNEILHLEARFDEGKLISLDVLEKAKKAESEKKSESEKKLKAVPVKPKKPVTEVKQEERKSPEEERRSLHLNMIKVYFDDIQGHEVHISHKVNPKVSNNYVEKKSHTGTYYRTKKDVLLCDAGPCEQQWSASFVYTDESGKADTISLTWKQTVFNGITPAGTSKRELLYCLNGACEHLEDATIAEKAQVATLGRYPLTWTKSSLIIRRADIMKEITDSGGVVDAY